MEVCSDHGLPGVRLWALGNRELPEVMQPVYGEVMQQVYDEEMPSVCSEARRSSVHAVKP